MWLKLLPYALGALELFKSKDALKENMTKPSTLAGLGTAVAAAQAPELLQAAGMAVDPTEAAITQIAMGIVALIMVLLRKKRD